MKPLLHHPSSFSITFFFSLALLMISIINIPKCKCDDDNQYYKSCNNSFSCGNSVTNLKYPFWGGSRAGYCGNSSDPNLMLMCESGVPKITINSVKYRIYKWEDTIQRLTVARDDYWSGICAVTVSNNSKNSTFNNTPFQRDDGVSSTLNVLYNCNTNGDSNFSITCGSNMKVAYTLDLGSIKCTPTVIIKIPISVTQASQIGTLNALIAALKDGFALKWRGDYEGWLSCVGSGGVCGSNEGTEFKCFCKDGAHTTTCFSQKAPAPTPTTSSKLNWWPIVIGAAGFGVLFLIIIMIRCHLKRGTGRQQKSIFRRRRKLVEHNVNAFMQNYNLSMPRRYRYTEVKRITNSFREKLGQGGYGVVYKASLNDGRQVAVKVINESKGNGEEFINEVASISRTSHMNIVSLLGYCYEGNKRALIYEFMPKGSLDGFIYKSEFPNAICDFDWNTLFQIAIGIARGLEYLHQGCNSRILHLDIKPQNILLDEDFCPKISDFGLAKICQKKDSIVSILGTRGTIGYMAPEIFSRAFGGVSYKSDVYSYGMLILEMIGGRKNYDTGGSCTSEMYFPDWIYKDLEQSNSSTLLNSLTISEEENDMVRKITLVSLWCIQTNPSDRPPMNKVIEMLQGPLLSVSYPPKPILFSPERPALPVECISSSDFNETSSITVSK
ncbi:LEAF RUST 10 DISEASE-RESISTANCE LOCUS RECEPTOR-LIKE PROTEIN KINASE-like 2.4 [Vicia villosa]|uniref:LEAF RUST 10 DISEASE-RESISTANCE LOCUS RECEPTOR-LIKE PROTEIN KINASE-like 2.4 n=1 Tax=Vicia villosa TaxID=3911 RepID=UPI00273B11CF|nr:LEAF RUST 10 DISEASE-RESISTANCE LOCUS RECEPTOR-LIKE PROTEIN KINASE-like 2.4 [Vicia villosa]